MKILFAGKQHFDPGGVQASVHDLARRLAVDHDVAVVAHRDFDAGPADLRFALTEEWSEPYPAWSSDLATPGAALGLAVRRFHPDVLVVNAGGWWWHDWTEGLVAAAPAELPVAVHVRDAGAIPLLTEGVVEADLVLANARAHADQLAAGGIDAVVSPSLVELEGYRTEPDGSAVVLINPHPTKGLDLAIELARARPDIPFRFRESWRRSESARQELLDRTRDLGNVDLVPHIEDRAARYADARVLLVPYGDRNRPRVVPEAQVSGIPILALDDPALRECVGPGGLLVGADAPIDEWAETLDSMWSDGDRRSRLAAAARAHAEREEIDPARIAARFAGAVAALAEQGPTRPRRRHTPSSGPAAVSVIVPVRDVESTIDDQLEALAGQTYEGSWEIVVADNGSTDGTVARVEGWRHALPPLRIVDASAHRGVGHARNVGLAAAEGDLLLICDGDDIVAPDWVEQLVAALEEHPIVEGAQDIVSLNEPDRHAWTGDQNRLEPRVAYDHLPTFSGGNVGLWREVVDELGGFDTDLRRAEDTDYAWRAAQAGIGIHTEPRALLHRRLRASPSEEFVIAVRGGVAEAGLHRRHRDRGMAAADWPTVRAEWAWLVRQVPLVARGADRHRWAHHAGKRIGRVAGSIRHRVRYL